MAPLAPPLATPVGGTISETSKYIVPPKSILVKSRFVFVCVFVCPDCIKVMGELKPHLYLRKKLTSKCYYR